MNHFPFIQKIKTVIGSIYYFFLLVPFLPTAINTWNMVFHYFAFQNLQKFFLKAHFQPAGYPRDNL